MTARAPREDGAGRKLGRDCGEAEARFTRVAGAGLSAATSPHRTGEASGEAGRRDDWDEQGRGQEARMCAPRLSLCKVTACSGERRGMRSEDPSGIQIICSFVAVMGIFNFTQSEKKNHRRVLSRIMAQ